MPVTPFHLGPGALAKSIAPRNFSFQLFFLSQVAMDIQPGINLLLGWRPLHGWTHTYFGAVFVGMLVMLVWRIWEKIRPVVFESPILSSSVLGVSCFFGTLSHVWLDSQFHQEMWRLTPNMARLLDPDQVETFCLATLGIAGIIFTVRLIATRLHDKKVGT